jgi:hypothetical protein
MDLLKTGSILLFLGLAIEIATSFGSREKWFGKVVHTVATTVMLIGLLLSVVGIIAWIF